MEAHHTGYQRTYLAIKGQGYQADNAVTDNAALACLHLVSAFLADVSRGDILQESCRK